VALPVWQDVINIAPGDAAAFGDPTKFPVATQNALLGYVTARLDPDTWGTLLNNGIVYLTAHLAKLGLLRGAGAVTQEAVGQLSRSYLAPKGAGGSRAYASLELTSYGLEFMSLLSETQAILGDVP
jgi:hypothetical protein